ncbi:DUF1093 domain-containing protein [Lactobacillus sp. S2-2]|uniref:DUF1093 domain-containing protein n=1 Tax=Lactobacillus sp. S2-2 TaxID=2692917 RepID=UPI001F35DBF2|nr:DUF1093 domain-containing protein [Lactobacillus sp. S2-2]MCF6515228.1 DUF1093 domain-containing protein [Lactobacillus sp. S2-2]
MKKIIIGIVIVLGIFLVFLGFKGVNGYYENNYKGNIQYSKIPAKVPEKKQTKDSDGKIIKGIHEYVYHLKFVDKNGKIKDIEYGLSGSKVSPFKTKKYVNAEISPTGRIIKGPNYIAKKDVPKSIINKIK